MRLSTSVLACLAMLGSPALAVAQSTVSHPRIGLLAWDTCEMPDLIAGLKDLGRMPGENIFIECRSAGKRYEGLAPATAELVKTSGRYDRLGVRTGRPHGAVGDQDRSDRHDPER